MSKRLADHWDKFPYWAENEPITESGNLDAIINLMKEELEDDKDNGKEILHLLREGVKKYLDKDFDREEEPLKPGSIDDEKGHDDRQRTSDLKASL